MAKNFNPATATSAKSTVRIAPAHIDDEGLAFLVRRNKRRMRRENRAL